MWRKIHSNRDPRDTLFTEIRKEFRGWFDLAGNRAKVLLGLYPKAFFVGMILLMLVSAGLSFTVFRQHEAKPVKAATGPLVKPAGDGFGQIIAVAGRIRETLQLKRTVDSLSSGKQLSAADSAALEKALDRLQHLQNH